MFYCRGAGKFPTASAVVSDVMECARNIGSNVECRWDDEVLKLSDPMKESFRYFIRVDSVEEKKAADLFGRFTVVEAKVPVEGELAFVTRMMTEREASQKCGEFKSIKQCLRLLQD